MFLKYLNGLSKKHVLLSSLFIFIFPFLIYASSINNDFLAGDDEEIILRNIYLHDWKFLPQMFTQNYKAGAGTVCNFWRPFQLLVYGLIIHTVGLKPWAFHIASIFFHGLCGIFLFLLFLKLFPQKVPISFIVLTVLIWLAHPIHNSEIAVTSGIASPSHLFWMLVALYSFVRFEKERKWYWFSSSLLGFIISLWCKESAVVLPGLLLGMHITGIKAGIFKKTGLKDFFLKHMAFWVIAVLYVLMRMTVLNFQNTFNFYNTANFYTENFSFRLYSLFTIFVHGLKIVFVPFGLHPERSWPIFLSFFSARVIQSLIVLIMVIFSAIWMWRKLPFFTFGIFWFFFSYFPMSNLIAKIHSLVWDHWFYTPLIGILLAVVAVVQTKRFQQVYMFIAVPFLILLTVVTIPRNHFWRDTETVSRFILKYEPRSAKTWNNLAMTIIEKGQYQEAIDSYKKAIDLSDIYPQTHHNLANAYIGLKKYDLAEQEFLKAISMDENFYYSHVSLGTLYITNGELKKAVEHFERAVEIYPHLPRIKEFLLRIEQK